MASKEDLDSARINIAFRDSCSHLLIELNKCRVDTLYVPWQCTDLRHAYEKCQYDEYVWEDLDGLPPL